MACEDASDPAVLLDRCAKDVQQTQSGAAGHLLTVWQRVASRNLTLQVPTQLLPLCLYSMAWLERKRSINPSAPVEKKNKKVTREKTVCRRHWGKSFDRIGLSNVFHVLSLKQFFFFFLKSHVPLEKCRLVLMNGENETSEQVGPSSNSETALGNMRCLIFLIGWAAASLLTVSSQKTLLCKILQSKRSSWVMLGHRRWQTISTGGVEVPKCHITMFHPPGLLSFLSAKENFRAIIAKYIATIFFCISIWHCIAQESHNLSL